MAAVHWTDDVVDECHRVEDGSCYLQREQASVHSEDVDMVLREGMSMVVVAVPVMSVVESLNWDEPAELVRDDEKWWDVGE